MYLLAAEPRLNMQVLSKTHDECNDPDESCDIDEIIEYAMPDGTTETVRHHTWPKKLRGE